MCEYHGARPEHIHVRHIFDSRSSVFPKEFICSIGICYTLVHANTFKQTHYFVIDVGNILDNEYK